MGYYSNFTMTITGEATENIINTIINNIEKISGYSFDKLDDWKEDCKDFYSSDIKWYSWVEDMKNISRQYPKNNFYIIREGENLFDYEMAKFINGEVLIKEISPKYPSWTNAEDIKIFNKIIFGED